MQRILDLQRQFTILALSGRYHNIVEWDCETYHEDEGGDGDDGKIQTKVKKVTRQIAKHTNDINLGGSQTIASVMMIASIL